jgi:EAL domain-containing protein (putative c-di-GMP-specific phosphodiesterase class I)
MDLIAHIEPIVRLSDGQVAARELLSRPYPNGSLDGMIGPPATMRSITEFALRSAGILLEGSALPVHVNVTPADLAGRDLPDRIGATISEVAWSYLVLEVTEHTELVTSPAMVENLIELRRRGIRFAVDDFGDGWADERSIATLCPEVVKVRLATLARPGLAARLRSLADEHQAQVVVEQVETAGDLARTLESGFAFGQGWFWDVR